MAVRTAALMLPLAVVVSGLPANAQAPSHPRSHATRNGRRSGAKTGLPNMGGIRCYFRAQSKQNNAVAILCFRARRRRFDANLACVHQVCVRSCTYQPRPRTPTPAPVAAKPAPPAISASTPTAAAPSSAPNSATVPAPPSALSSVPAPVPAPTAASAKPITSAANMPNTATRPQSPIENRQSNNRKSKLPPYWRRLNPTPLPPMIPF